MTAPTRWPDNVPGRFYVDVDCLVCTVCLDAAPALFAFDDEATHSRVVRQPVTADELAAMTLALENCACGAIHDGDSEGG